MDPISDKADARAKIKAKIKAVRAAKRAQQEKESVDALIELGYLDHEDPCRKCEEIKQTKRNYMTVFWIMVLVYMIIGLAIGRFVQSCAPYSADSCFP
jgi:uncharacterized membrane protein YraQ (UPF0718 family)